MVKRYTRTSSDRQTAQAEKLPRELDRLQKLVNEADLTPTQVRSDHIGPIMPTTLPGAKRREPA